RGADAARSEQNANAFSGVSAHGKNPFAKDSQQRQDTAAYSPGRLNHQVSKNPWPTADVMRPFNGVGNSDSPAYRQFALVTGRTFRNPHRCNQKGGSNEGQR